ncbi:MAG: hypothetical protein Q9170_007658, partial [Blastenia crenularia]
MAIQLSVAAIWGIGVGGAVLAILLGAGLVFLLLHRKHKALLTSKTRDNEWPRAHLSITDEDVMRMPGMRRIRPSPYNRQSAWTPVSSRENVAKRGLAPNPADVDPVTGVPPWPVRIPRRLKKIQSSPMVRVPLTALSPITERSANNTVTSPSLSKVTNSDTENQQQPKNKIVGGVYRLSGCPDPDALPGQMKPKPLFHGQQRSLSQGILSEFYDESKPKDTSEPVKRTAEARDIEKARMRRSTSLCSQQPGQMPTIPIPPLPFELPINRRSQLSKPLLDASPQRISGMSLLSGDTSLLDELASRKFSQADTDFTSISLTSPPGSSSTTVGLGISNSSHSKWNFSRVDRAASPLSATKALRPQISQQHSFRA